MPSGGRRHDRRSAECFPSGVARASCPWSDRGRSECTGWKPVPRREKVPSPSVVKSFTPGLEADMKRLAGSRCGWWCVLSVWLAGAAAAAFGQPLDGTEPLTTEGDLASLMVDGIDKFLLRETEA